MHGERRWRLVALVALLVLAAPLLPWMLARSTSSEAFTGLLLIAVGVGLLARTTTTTTTTVTTATATVMATARSTAALAHLGAGLCLAGVAIDVRLLQAAGVATLATALLAAWSPGRRAGLAALGLVLLGLPLAGDIDVVGFPLRRLSAELAALALPILGVPVDFAETVLVTEHGIADVEAPCAGLSTLRLLLASVAVLGALRGTRLAPLGAAFGVAVAVAVLGNASRVTLLSWLVLGARAPDLAGLLHVPLGVLVFLAAAAAAVPLLGRQAAPSAVALTWAPDRGLVAVALSAALAAGGATGLRALRPADAAVATAPPLPTAPHDHGDDDVALSAAEVELYGRHALLARKRRLRDGAGEDIGEVLVVVTRGLRAIHAPERCLAGNGHAVIDSAVVERAGLPVKRLVLDDGRIIGLSLLRSARGSQATGLGDVVMARLGLGDRGRDDGPWVFISVVVASDAPGGVDEDALVARLVGEATTLLTTSGLSP